MENQNTDAFAGVEEEKKRRLLNPCPKLGKKVKTATDSLEDVLAQIQNVQSTIQKDVKEREMKCKRKYGGEGDLQSVYGKGKGYDLYTLPSRSIMFNMLL